MRLKTFVILTAVTAVVSVAAIVEQSGTPSVTRIKAGEKLFAGLAGHLKDVTSIEVAEHDKTFTILRKGDKWTMREHGGYPVNPDVVKKVLTGMVEAETLEAKTDQPALYSRLHVEDVTAKGAKSTLVTLKNAAGKDLARLIVGKSRVAQNGGAAAGLYVRRPGQARSWLVKTTLAVDRDPIDWLNRKVTDIGRDRVSRVTTVQPDGARLVLVKDKPGEAGSFAIEGTVPPGMKPKSQGDLGAPAGALSGLEFDDVKPAGDIDFGKKPVGRAEYRTFDGLVVSIRMSQVGDNVWAIVAASVDPASRREPAKTKTETAGNTNAGAKAGTEAAAGKKPAEDKKKAASEKKKPAMRSLAEVRKEAAAINARVKGWAYKLPSFAVSQFQSKLADMIVKKKSS